MTSNEINVGDRVQIEDYDGGEWRWVNRYGTVTVADKYCYTVHCQNGVVERDVKSHYRRPQ